MQAGVILQVLQRRLLNGRGEMELEEIDHG